jgi:hypothetical protein
MTYDEAKALERQKEILLAALNECITDDPAHASYNTGRKTRRLEAINALVREAIAKATGE